MVQGMGWKCHKTSRFEKCMGKEEAVEKFPSFHPRRKLGSSKWRLIKTQEVNSQISGGPYNLQDSWGPSLSLQLIQLPIDHAENSRVLVFLNCYPCWDRLFRDTAALSRPCSCKEPFTHNSCKLTPVNSWAYQLGLCWYCYFNLLSVSYLR